MKNYYWIIFISLFILTNSCKKELGSQLASETERTVPYSNLPSHCYNNVKDVEKGETDIDCGGPCLACQAEATPTCTVAPDTAIINNVAYKIIYTGKTSQSSITSYKFSILNTPYSNVYGKLFVHDSHTALEPSTVSSYSGAEEIEITYSNYNTWGATQTNAVGGQAFINTRADGSHEITVCSSSFSTVFYNSPKNISFKLLIP